MKKKSLTLDKEVVLQENPFEEDGGAITLQLARVSRWVSRVISEHLIEVSLTQISNGCQTQDNCPPTSNASCDGTCGGCNLSTGLSCGNCPV